MRIFLRKTLMLIIRRRRCLPQAHRTQPPRTPDARSCRLSGHDEAGALLPQSCEREGSPDRASGDEDGLPPCAKESPCRSASLPKKRGWQNQLGCSSRSPEANPVCDGEALSPKLRGRGCTPVTFAFLEKNADGPLPRFHPSPVPDVLRKASCTPPRPTWGDKVLRMVSARPFRRCAACTRSYDEPFFRIADATLLPAA
jgi:hypothetical protein